MQIKKYFLKKILQLYLLIAVFLGFVQNTYAEENPNFQIIGKNSEVNFDIPQNILSSKNLQNAMINNNTGAMSGHLYLKDIGFAKLKNGVKNTSGENIIFSWEAESQSIGNMKISLTFSQNTGETTGKIFSRAGIIPLTGISLKNLNTHLNLHHLKANNNAKITVENPSADANYELKIKHWWQIIGVHASENNIFNNVDISLASKYDFIFTITKNGEKKSIEHKNIIVKPAEISKNIVPWDFFAKNFCKNNTSNSACPDGWEKKWSHIQQVWKYISEKIFFHIHLRDQFGNKIVWENISFIMKKNNSLSISEKSPSVTVNPDKISGNLVASANYSFFIKSQHPANEWEISWQEIKYNGENIVNKISYEKIKILWALEIVNNFPDSILNEIPTTIVVESKKNIGIPQPKILVSITGNDHFDSLVLDGNPKVCKSDLWDDSQPSPCHQNILDQKAIFAYWQTENIQQKNISITPKITTDSEEATLEIFGIYTINSNNIQEKLLTKNIIVKNVVGKNFAVLNGIWNSEMFENAIISTQVRTNFMNEIRKNVTYLKRNLQNNTAKNYLIINGNAKYSEVKNEKFLSYIILGGNFEIDTNIENLSETPIAIISLEENGVGGNIIIDKNVTKIGASIIAENQIQWNGHKNSQLFIEGLVSAKNMCENESYCFLNMREGYNFKNPLHKRYLSNNPDKIIIKYDPKLRFIQPPGIQKFVE